MKLFKLYIFAAITLITASCQKDDFDLGTMTADQQALIGRAVDFNASIADEYATRTIYNDKGIFCDNDVMRIYRQYYSNGKWEVDAQGKPIETYRTYHHKNIQATGTDITLEVNWKAEELRTGYNAYADAYHGANETFVQTDADSLTWENGKTVRFRAWSRSNFYNSIVSSAKERYYPDFCIADHANASGPTKGIALALNHMGSRIVFSRKDGGNEFHKVEICWEDEKWEDYKRKDNSTTTNNDNSSTEAGKTDDQAKADQQLVKAVWQRMCMPAGVDMDGHVLMAMKHSFWESADNDKIKYLENYESYGENGSESAMVKFGTLSEADIATVVERPKFSYLWGSCYLISIPYDMSTNTATQGNILVLPPCTRFRVYLYDVNNGDQYNNGSYEGTYHIFSLADIAETDASGNIVYEKDEQGNNTTTPKKKFPNGLELVPGRSYRFYVGYRYGLLTITADDNFSWDEQDLGDANLGDKTETETPSTAADYGWWKTAISDAIPTGTQNFNPVFQISNRKEFLEFISLVNGTATDKTETDPLRSKIIIEKNPDGSQRSKTYKWYKVDQIVPGAAGSGRNDTIWLNPSDLEAEGYIFYEHYHAANADKAAYSETDYLRGNYSFYDDNLRSHFKVQLTADLDLADWELTAIGVNQDKPFQGYFDGQGHLIKNLNMGSEGYLFKYMDAGAIYNLRMESTHKVSLLKEATNGAYILGISMLADCKTNPLAEKLTGTSFVVGCIHVGDGAKALVGEGNNIYMYGCMKASEGTTAGGALLGKYTSGATSFFAAQTGSKVTWGRFMCNYYDKSLWPNANAVGTVTDTYKQLQYIRGAKTFVLKAKNDNLIEDDVPWDKLNTTQQSAFYGLAPWKAMNYAIWKYNSQYGSTHACTMHYESNTTGYDHCYPVLKSGQCTNGVPAGITNYDAINPIEQNN